MKRHTSNLLPFGNVWKSGNQKVTIMARSNNEVICPITATLQYIGGRWKAIILYFLTSGQKRFGEIAARIPSISRKVLTQQLKEMESDGLIFRTSYKETPPRVEYGLTDLGKSLTSVFKEMAVWGKDNVLSKTQKNSFWTTLFQNVDKRSA